ncbi:hypothetical protein [Streptomyces canus]|uniref:hypothetical protein n=1 Tax=Streptomyces canus TaxID=58343 RepID=UPI002E32E37B|nr:hypothetical protein [Streptomyces canus]
MATYYQARVSQDQLEQAQKDSQLEARQQAAEVSFWSVPEPEKPGLQSLHVANRSPDPIYSVKLRFQTPGAPPLQWEMDVGDIGPCIEFVYRSNNLKDDAQDALVALPDRALLSVMYYTDRDGRQWLRTAKQLLKTDQTWSDVRYDLEKALPDTIPDAVDVTAKVRIVDHAATCGE